MCYVANRSFKSYVPFLGDKLWDEPLARADAVLLGGVDVPQVSILFTAALFAHRVRLGRRVRIVAWVWFALTTVATVYFGWHYVLDDVAGLAIGWVAVEAAVRTSSVGPSAMTAEQAQVPVGGLAPVAPR